MRYITEHKRLTDIADSAVTFPMFYDTVPLFWGGALRGPSVRINGSVCTSSDLGYGLGAES